MSRHDPRRLLLTLLGVGLMVLLASSPAMAHASLEGGTVFDGDVVDVAPEELVLDFNESVTAPRAGLRVHASDGSRVDVGDTFTPEGSSDRVGVQLEPGLSDGTYAVTYRVTSADGHPISGAYIFSVGQAAGDADALLSQVFSGDGDRPWAIAAALTRFAMYGATLLAAGAVLAMTWLGASTLQSSDWAALLIRRAALVAIVASAIGIVLQNVLVTGEGVAALVDLPGLWQILISFVGISAVVRVLGAVLLRFGPVGGPVTLVGAVVALGSLLLEGHTLTTGPAFVVWGGSVVHIAAASIWLGGLAVMAKELRSRRRADDPVAAGHLVARFSTLFTISVLAVVAAGSALTWAEVRATRALTSTTYGWTLVAKMVTVLPLLLIGLYNNQRLVPTLAGRRRRARSKAANPATAVIAGGSDELAERASRRDDAWALLARVTRIEVGLIAAVLAVTSVLVALQPAAEAAGITGAYSANQEFPGIGQMSFTVDPNRVGRNEVHLYLLTDTGRPNDAGGPDSVTLSLTQPELDIGPIEATPLYSGPGHWVLSGNQLAVPGRWQITTTVELNRFDVVETTTEVVVNP